MGSQIEIVIRGTDRFSRVFDILARTLGDSSNAALKLELGTESLAEGFEAMARQATRAGDSAGQMTSELLAQIEATVEAHRQALERMAEQQAEADEANAERRRAQQEAEQEERRANREQSNAEEEQAENKHQANLGNAAVAGQQVIVAAERNAFTARANLFIEFSTLIQGMAIGHGRTLANLGKKLAIADALIATYAGANNALARVPYPLNFAAAALVTAQGLANVRKIQQTPIAHGGLENVQQESTFLLQRGERILSPGQNRDLTRFLRQSDASGLPQARESFPGPEQRQQLERSAKSAGQADAGSPVTIQNLTMHVMENATTGDAILSMTPEDIQQVVAEKIIPAMDELARLGVRPKFISNNT